MEIECDDEYGTVIIDSETYTVDEACGLAEELEKAIEEAYAIIQAREGRPDDVYEYERDERNS